MTSLSAGSAGGECRRAGAQGAVARQAVYHPSLPYDPMFWVWTAGLSLIAANYHRKSSLFKPHLGNWACRSVTLHVPPGALQTNGKHGHAAGEGDSVRLARAWHQMWRGLGMPLSRGTQPSGPGTLGRIPSLLHESVGRGSLIQVRCGVAGQDAYWRAANLVCLVMGNLVVWGWHAPCLGKSLSNDELSVGGMHIELAAPQLMCSSLKRYHTYTTAVRCPFVRAWACLSNTDPVPSGSSTKSVGVLGYGGQRYLNTWYLGNFPITTTMMVILDTNWHADAGAK